MKLQICLIPRTHSWLPRIISTGNKESKSNNGSPSTFLASSISASPASLVVSGCYRKFLHIVSPDIGLEELCNEISEKHAKLYPDDPPLKIERLQDLNECDLDLGYSVGEVFDDSNIVRVIIDPDSMPFRRKRKLPDSSYESLMSSNEYAKRQAVSKNRLSNGNPRRNYDAEDSSQSGLFGGPHESPRKVRYSSVTLTPPTTLLSNSEFLQRINREQQTDSFDNTIQNNDDIENEKAPLEIAESIMGEVLADHGGEEVSESPVVHEHSINPIGKLSNSELAELALERLKKQQSGEHVYETETEQIIMPGLDVTKVQVDMPTSSSTNISTKSTSDKEASSAESDDNSAISIPNTSGNLQHERLNQDEKASDLAISTVSKPEGVVASSALSPTIVQSSSQQSQSQQRHEDSKSADEPQGHNSASPEHIEVQASENHTNESEVQIPASPETGDSVKDHQSLDSNHGRSVVQAVPESVVEDNAADSGISHNQSQNKKEAEALIRDQEDDTLSPSISQSLDEPSARLDKAKNGQVTLLSKPDIPPSQSNKSESGPAADLVVQDSVDSSKGDTFVPSLNVEDSNTQLSSNLNDDLDGKARSSADSESSTDKNKVDEESEGEESDEDEDEDEDDEDEDEDEDASDESIGSPPPSRRPRAVFSSTDEIITAKGDEAGEVQHPQSLTSSTSEAKELPRAEISNQEVVNNSQQTPNIREGSSQSLAPPSISSSQIPSSFNESHEKVSSPSLPNRPSMAARSFKTLKDLVRRGVPEVHDAHSSREKQVKQQSRNRLPSTKDIDPDSESNSESESDGSSSSSSSSSSSGSDSDDPNESDNRKRKMQRPSQQSHIPPEKRAGSSQTSSQRPRRNNALRSLFKR